MSASLMTYSFPLRTFDAAGTSAPMPFLLRRFHGDGQNKLVRLWCDAEFMRDQAAPWPLVLYGPSGTGKTALAETLAGRLKLQCTNLSGDEFRRQFLTAVATRSTLTFRQKIRAGEMLLLDGLALPEDEPALIREMVQLIGFYQEKHRPVIVTTRQIPWMTGSAFSQLNSRLSEGLTIEVKRPGVAARREIAAEILHHLGFGIVDEDLDWLVRSLPETVPMIKSYLSHIALEFEDSLLTREALMKRSGEVVTTVDPQSVHQLVKLVARQFGRRVSEITGQTRRQEVVRARSVAMYLTRELLGTTFRETGELIGNRDPSTVRHACVQIKKRIARDYALATAVNQVAERFAGYLDRTPG